MRYKFAAFELNTERHELTKDGEAIKVEPLVFDLLRLLVENPGVLISRDRLVDEVWRGRIVSDSAISASIAAARSSVGDSGKRQAIIQTVPRRGIRLNVAVETQQSLPEPASANGKHAASAPDATEAKQRVRYLKNDRGQNLAYAVTGTGPPVLYCRLWAANLELEWQSKSGRSFFEALTRHFTIVRFDPVGMGMSDRSAIETDFRKIASDALAIMDALGFNAFSIYSTSGGILPAAYIAAERPERVKKLAIVGGYVDGRARRADNTQDDVIKHLMLSGWEEPEGAFATSVLTSYFPEGPFDAVKEFVRLMQSAATTDSVLAFRDAINDVSIEPVLGRIQCPTLILHGNKDAIHPVSEAKKMAAGIENSELVLLDTANHLPLPETAVWTDYMETLIDFLTD